MTIQYANVFWETDQTEAQLIAGLKQGQIGGIASDTGSFVQKMNDNSIKIIKAIDFDTDNYLGKDNTDPYTPMLDYHPAIYKNITELLALINLPGFVVSNEVADFTIQNKTIHFVITTDTLITGTAPDATVDLLRASIYKVSDVDTEDVAITTVGGTQLIGGSTSQLIQGESEGISLTEHTVGYQVTQDNRGGIPNKLSRSSMILSGFEISNLVESVPASGVFDTFDIGAGLYSTETVEANNLTRPQSKRFRFKGLTGVTVPDVSAATAYTVVSVTSETTIKLTPGAFPTIADQVNNPRIVVLIHLYGTIDIDPANWWTAGANPSTRVSSMLDFDGIRQKGILISPASTDLSIAHTSGVFLGDSLDAHDGSPVPDIRNVEAVNPIQLIIPTVSETVSAFLPPLVGASALLDPTHYDDGTVTPALVGGATGSATVQRVFILTNCTIFIAYGQNVYGSFTDAIVALFNGEDSFTIHPKLSGTSVHVANIVVGKNCVDLSDINLARFYEPLVGGSTPSVSTGKLTDLLDTPSSYIGEAGSFLMVTDAETELDWAKSSSGTPTYHNSWVADGVLVPECTKDGLGNVQVTGSITSGIIDTDTLAVTLPVGFRPPTTLYFNLVANASFGNLATCLVRVQTDGGVYLYNANQTWTSLTGISFRL